MAEKWMLPSPTAEFNFLKIQTNWLNPTAPEDAHAWVKRIQDCNKLISWWALLRNFPLDELWQKGLERYLTDKHRNWDMPPPFFQNNLLSQNS
jgi:hypothetical protein